MKNYVTKASQMGVLIVNILLLAGCSSAINPFYNMHPAQKRERFLKRYPVPDNAFVANGGLVNKSNIPGFMQSINDSGFYTINPNFKALDQKNGGYKDPLASTYSQHNNTQQEAVVQKGQSSSITTFFKEGYQEAKGWFSGDSSQNSPVGHNNNPSSHNHNSIDSTLKEGEQYLEHEKEVISEEVQGGGSSLGYSYYDLANDIVPTPVYAPIPTRAIPPQQIKQPTIQRMDTFHPQSSKKSANEQGSNANVIYSHHPEKTEFDEYYIQQNKQTLGIKGVLNKYIKKVGGFIIGDANAAEDIMNHSNVTQEDLNKMDDITAPIITPEDSAAAKKVYPELKDIPPSPKAFKNQSIYHKEMESLAEQVS